jgi:hypothetical protein
VALRAAAEATTADIILDLAVAGLEVVAVVIGLEEVGVVLGLEVVALGLEVVALGLEEVVALGLEEVRVVAVGKQTLVFCVQLPPEDEHRI